MSFFDPRFLNLSDAVIESEDGHSFRVHKIILAMKSEYFCSMFCDIDDDRRQFKIPGVSGKSLQEILKYIYNGKMIDTQQKVSDFTNLSDLMTAADYLCLQDLYLHMRQHLTKAVNDVSLSFPNCLPVLNTAHIIEDEGITREPFRFVETKFEEIMRWQVNELTELNLEVLERILNSRSLNVTSESTVWRAIAEWTRKDIASRSECVPRLLLCLARKELDENLAQKILKHQIVSENIVMKDLNGLKDSPDFASYLDALLHFLENHLNSSKEPLYYRIPARLHLSGIGLPIESLPYRFYISYDEQTDLWRGIPASLFKFVENSTVAGHSIYVFHWHKCQCNKFDMITEQWIPMPPFPEEMKPSLENSVFTVDGYVYIFRTLEDGQHVITKLYETPNARWLDEGSLSGFEYATAVPLNEKIYVVGKDDSQKMATRMFDTVTKRWEVLPSPKIRFCYFSLLTCCEKVYVVGGFDKVSAEFVGDFAAFDPKTNLWDEVPPVPVGRLINRVKAVVLNNQLIVKFECLGEHGCDFDFSTFYWSGVM